MSKQIDVTQTIKKFLVAAQKDKNILPLHISLFMAICWGGTPDNDAAAFTIYRKDIMPLARMASCATYHKYLKDTPDNDAAAFTIYRKDIMPLARMASCATYHKYLKELVAFGYLEYQPTHDYYTGSKVKFLK